MKKRRVAFGTPEEVTNPGDDSRSFLFPFTCVDADLVGSPEEARVTTEHQLIVTAQNRRLLTWEYSEPELVKVLFEIGQRRLVENLEQATLERETRVLVHTENHSNVRPYDASRIQVPEGTVIEVEERRSIGFK